MDNWFLMVRNDEIVGGGKNVVFDGSFDRVIPTTEQFARQGMKLDLINGDLVVKENVVIKTIEELNEESLELVKEITDSPVKEELEIVTPINF